MRPNTATVTARIGTGTGETAALWLGPDEWLIVGEMGAQAALVGALTEALEGVHHSVVDVSANRVALDLGPEGPDVLASGCTLDFDPTRWQPGSCAQTILGSVPVLLHQRPEGTRVFVRPSYAAWLLAWLDAVFEVRSL